jgi:hypothetical protein
MAIVWSPTKQYINNNKKYSLNENYSVGTQNISNLQFQIHIHIWYIGFPWHLNVHVPNYYVL